MLKKFCYLNRLEDKAEEVLIIIILNNTPGEDMVMCLHSDSIPIMPSEQTLKLVSFAFQRKFGRNDLLFLAMVFVGCPHLVSSPVQLSWYADIKTYTQSWHSWAMKMTDSYWTLWSNCWFETVNLVMVQALFWKPFIYYQKGSIRMYITVSPWILTQWVKPMNKITSCPHHI